MKRCHRAALLCLTAAAAFVAGCGSEKPVGSEGPTGSDPTSTRPVVNALDGAESGAGEPTFVEGDRQATTAVVSAPSATARTASEDADSSSPGIFLPDADAEAPGPELPGLPLQIGAKPKPVVKQ